MEHASRMWNVIKGILWVATCCLSLFVAPVAQAERIKDLASIQGVRHNQLIGYGLVVGLDGSGDQTTQTPFTVQTITSMLQQLGINVPTTGTQMQLKNVAAVMVTASLPPFAQPGQTLDITVSSIGNAKSLRGGTLLMTPLKGADGNIYAMAQGNVVVSGTGGAIAGAKPTPNHLSVGRISAGATVERSVPNVLAQGNQIHLELNENSFSNAKLVVEAINRRFGANTAAAQNGRVIRVRVPVGMDEKVSFLASLESIDVRPAKSSAKIILNARTGSVVLNQAVMLEPCAVSHGNLSVVVSNANGAGQQGAAAQEAVTQASQIEIKKEQGQVLLLKNAPSLADVVKALNAIGATPQDLLAILQAMKVAGSLRAELEII